MSPPVLTIPSFEEFLTFDADECNVQNWLFSTTKTTGWYNQADPVLIQLSGWCWEQCDIIKASALKSHGPTPSHDHTWISLLHHTNSSWHPKMDSQITRIYRLTYSMAFSAIKIWICSATLQRYQTLSSKCFGATGHEPQIFECTQRQHPAVRGWHRQPRGYIDKRS